MTNTLEKQIEEFLPRPQKHVNEDYAKFMPSHKDWAPELAYMSGRRFIRIVVLNKETKQPASAFGFIDKETGKLWKCAGWAGPAKNFPRGHVSDENLSRISWTGIS